MLTSRISWGNLKLTKIVHWLIDKSFNFQVNPTICRKCSYIWPWQTVLAASKSYYCVYISKSILFSIPPHLGDFPSAEVDDTVVSCLWFLQASLNLFALFIRTAASNNLVYPWQPHLFFCGVSWTRIRTRIRTRTRTKIRMFIYLIQGNICKRLNYRATANATSPQMI